MMTIPRVAPLLAILGVVLPSAAQHLHIQTSFTHAAGWEIFWHDFDGAGSFPADSFTQPLARAARARIPNDPVLTNALGDAGNPVWTLPQEETIQVPSLGLGAQGQNVFVGAQIQLRLATFSGPGHLAIYNTGPFGEAILLLTTRDGLTAADAVPLTLPGGHRHVNWAFTRPGTYELGWQASGTLTGGTPTNSAIETFRFSVAAPMPPRLRLAQTNSQPALTVETEGRLPLRVEISTNLTHWTEATNLWLTAPTWNWTYTLDAPVRFYRAMHAFP